jgi:hypothetical protein
MVAAMFLLSTDARAESAYEQYFRGSHVNFELSDDTITDTSKLEAEVEIRYRNDDVSAFVRGSNDRPFGYQEDSFQLTKWGLNYDLNDDWTFTAGDYSLVFGRGLALMATEDRPVDRDSQLDGAMLHGRVGDTAVTAFWGQHKSRGFEYYVSGVNTNAGGPSDELYGGCLDFDFNDLDIGASYVNAQMTRWDNPESTVVTELDVSWRVEDVTLYYETAWFNREEPEGSEESMDGRGQLGEILFDGDGYSLSGSWVRYDHAAFDYATAPTLKRMEVDDSASDPYDQTGWRFDSRFAPESWNGHALRALYTSLNGIDNKNQRFKNIYLEWSTPATKDWSGSLSYDRISGNLIYYGALSGEDENFRVTIDGPCPLGGNMHIYGRYRNLSNEFGDDDETELGLDWSISPEFTLGFFRETSSRDTEPPPPGLIGIPTESPGHWNSMFVKYLPDPWSELELLIGSQRGGFQCSGGVCAQLPPFKGVRFTYYRVF